jgi:hypothetical protein
MNHGGGEEIAEAKYGGSKTLDWDDNPKYPPPHCGSNIRAVQT